MKTKKENEFLRELEKAANELPLMQYFLDNDDLRNGLFEQYTNTETRPDLRLYFGKYFTEKEWISELVKNNEVIPIHSASSATNFVPVTDFDKKIGEIETEFYDLLKNKNLSEDYYNHSIYETEIVVTLNLISTDIKDFQKRIIDAKDFDLKVYSDSFAKKLIRRIENLNIPELTTIILEDFVKNDNNTEIEIECIVNQFTGGSGTFQDDEIKGQYRELKMYADNFINDYLEKMDNSEKTKIGKTIGRPKASRATAQELLTDKIIKKKNFLLELKKEFLTANAQEFVYLLKQLYNLNYIKKEPRVTYYRAFENHFGKKYSRDNNKNNFWNEKEDSKLMDKIESRLINIKESTLC